MSSGRIRRTGEDADAAVLCDRAGRDPESLPLSGETPVRRSCFHRCFSMVSVVRMSGTQCITHLVSRIEFLPNRAADRLETVGGFSL
jgi:hypothetical protein